MSPSDSLAQETARGHGASLRNHDGSWKHTNALINDTSPYLLQHAHNPVNWHPWGPTAFEAARNSGKLIFLSVGYSTCYWCHVMEREVFENPQLAALLNEHCVSIKVDREERPDVDEIYMTAVQLMTGHGGWPMSVFLTPPGAGGEKDGGLKPLWAGTYIPPQPSGHLPGFGQVILSIHEAWTQQRQAVIQQADRVAGAVDHHLRQKVQPAPLGDDLVQNTTEQLLDTFDPAHGGFGSAPKFPQPANLLFLLSVYQSQPTDKIATALSLTLERMAHGGMYDQVGGGFHRYSTDERWLVPHFEKMLYDNGQLVEAYLTAQANYPHPKDKRLYERVVRQTCDYVLREMTDPTGAFWSAQDAEVNGREGENYLWTPQQIRAAIDDEQQAELAVRLYGLDRGTNFQDPHHRNEPPSNVLYLPQRLDALAGDPTPSLEDLVAAKQQIDQQLLSVRNRRQQPATDDKILLSWNGIMIAALARAGSQFNHTVYTQAAVRAASCVLSHMQRRSAGTPEPVEAGLYRTMRHGHAKIPALLEDYAYFVHGLIELHRATNENRWLTSAEKLTATAKQQFSAEADRGGGYYDTLANQSDLFVRTVSHYDGAMPSGNSQMIHNLIDLYALTHKEIYINQATRDLESFSGALARRGAAMVHMQHALWRAMRLAPQRFTRPSAEATPETDNAVSVTVDRQAVDLTSGSARLRVTVAIKDGYHVNAAEPGQATLVPTTLRLTGAPDIRLSVDAPAALKKRYPFAPDDLWVYEGTVTFDVTLKRIGSNPASHEKPQLRLRYQACTEQACLEPQEIVVPVAIDHGSPATPHD